MNQSPTPANLYQRRYDRKVSGVTAKSFPCIVREWSAVGCVTFSVVMLIDDDATPDLLVDRWLCRNVSEVEARSIFDTKRRTMTSETEATK